MKKYIVPSERRSRISLQMRSCMRESAYYFKRMEMKSVTDAPMSGIAKMYRGITVPIRLLPDFLIIGTQRGGTTSLYNYLIARPGVGPAMVKELHFFDKKFNKGFLWYRAHFPSSIQKYSYQFTHKQTFVTGEASAYYLFHPHAPKRVAKLLPHVKLIVMLRNPVDRAYSQYNFEVDLGRETLTFEDAIEHEEERISNEKEKMLADESYVSFDYSRYSYLARGIYADQLQTWMSLFPKKQFLMLQSEDFYADPVNTLEQTSKFLNLPELEAHEKQKKYRLHNYNTTPYPKMNPDTRKRLIEYFEPHNARLYDLLGVNFGWNKSAQHL